MTDAAPTSLSFRALTDEPPSLALSEVFAAYWPAYRRWMRRAQPIPLGTCTAKLVAHMPELVPTFERLLHAFGGTADAARFLTLYCPPRVVRGCSQLVFDAEDGPALIRSYDHHPRLFDGLVLASRWCETETLAVTDCLWGALDGINEHGLAVALAFGGRDSAGPGFAAPLLVRYVLETCTTVAEARAALGRVPCYMSYTFVVVDTSGEFVTAFLNPEQPARFVAKRASTNHQGAVQWPAYCRFSQSLERLGELESMLSGSTDIEAVRAAFEQPPLRRHNYTMASGTLYVAEYRPRDRTMALSWPGRTERFAVGQPIDREFTVDLAGGLPA